MRKITLLLATVLAIGLMGGPALADHFTFPSTNDANRANGWAHVNEVETGIGVVTLEFVSDRTFYSCFEYRTDGDTDQATDGENPNADAHDLYPYVCVRDEVEQNIIEADEYVEVRMVFGAEGDERFDWTRFDVIADVSSKEQCKDDWADFGFRNQGQCIRFVNTGKDSRE